MSMSQEELALAIMDDDGWGSAITTPVRESAPAKAPPVFTVTRKGQREGQDAILGARYVLTVDRLPGWKSKPQDFRSMSDELYVAALVTRAEARNTILDAFCTGSASIAGTQAS